MKEVEDALRKLVVLFREYDIKIKGFDSRYLGPQMQIGERPACCIVDCDDCDPEPERTYSYVINADTLMRCLKGGS